MVSSIVSNIAAFAAQANIANASANAAASISRLSSGHRIVKSSDDVAGLAVGTSLATQVTTLKSALANTAQGTSLLQVADGALQQINSILQQQQSIAIQAGSGSLSDTDRGFLDQEFQALTKQIDQIAQSTNFNGVNLLNGGLGTSTALANTDALSAAFTPTATGSANGVPVASTVAIQAFNIQTGASLAGTTAGKLNVTDSAGTTLADGAYLNVPSNLVGQFSNFTLTNVVYGVSATVNATINGVTYSGTAATGATNATLQNGNSYIKIGFTALTLTNAGTVQTSQDQLGKDFANTVIQRTSQIQGVDFSGTRLTGAVGAAATGISEARLSTANATISNFQYAGNLSAADTSILTVDVNGQTFTATGVKDAIATAAGKIVFTSQDQQMLTVDLTGLTTAFTNLRTNPGDSTALVNALNQGFAKAGSGLNFSVGTSGASGNINVSVNSAGTANLFSGQSLSVGTAASAAIAATAIGSAVNTLSAIQSQVGALESRFGYASASIQSTIQNADAARGALLDTDVSAESTAYASSQVQLQAGIAVLAQANLLPQNLLKLIQ